MTITVTASLIHSYLENATLDTFVISDPGMKENDMDAVVRRITRTFSSKRYIDRLTGSKKNWIGEEIPTVTTRQIDFLKSLES